MPPTRGAIYTDEEVMAISEKMDEACKRGLFKGIRCAVIGANCTKTHIATVLVHPGFESRPRNVDLYVERYIDDPPNRFSGVEDLDKSGHCIRRYPYSAPRQQPLHWSIFEPGSLFNEPPPPRNRLFDTFKCSDAQRAVYGNIVVVKSLPDGTVCDVLERELYHIERVVYSFKEDADSDSWYPVIWNPLMEEPPPRQGSWSRWSFGQ